MRALIFLTHRIPISSQMCLLISAQLLTSDYRSSTNSVHLPIRPSNIEIMTASIFFFASNIDGSDSHEINHMGESRGYRSFSHRVYDETTRDSGTKGRGLKDIREVSCWLDERASTIQKR